VSAITAVLPSVSGLLNTSSTEGTARVAYNNQELKDLVEFFKVLSDETRLKILQYLANQSELHVRALCELLKQSQPAVSHHLALLRMVGLIECRRDGKHNYYHLVPSRFREVQETLTGSKPALALWAKFFTS
jgi:ArsR family transcriptional regulator